MADFSNKPSGYGREEVNWGLEVLHVFALIGKRILKFLSYIINILLTVLLIGLITGIIVATVFAIYINNYLDLTIDPSLLSLAGGGTTTTRFYTMQFESEEDRINRNGTAVEWEEERIYGTENSIYVPYSQMPKDLIDAFTAIEDHRFWQHNGVDWITTSKAIFYYLTGNSIAGGSTITQQLVKNLTGDDDFTIQRKVEEIFRALNLEKELSKEEIIEKYLNIVYLGNGCKGVQAASNLYFGKDVSELTFVQCASLAAIVKNPSQYEPLYHEEDYVRENGEIREGNRTRRNDVIFRMWDLEMITMEKRDKEYESDIEITYFDKQENANTTNEGFHVYSWYIESAIDAVEDDLMEEYGLSRDWANIMVLSSGYKIYLPIDLDVQRTLEEVYVNDDKYFPSSGSGLQPQSAMVVMDPYTGDVLGLVGGRGEKILNLGINRASKSVRPPGSSIKPVTVYAPALDAGLITYGSVIDDTPLYFDNENPDPTGTPYYDPYPHNLPDTYKGLTTINSAVERSVNTVALKVLEKLTVERSFDFAKNKLHIDSLVDSVTLSSGNVLTDRGLAALGLGQLTYGLTVLELTSAYCMFQNNGVYNTPNLYLYVMDSDDQLVLNNTDDPEIVISDETASIMTVMLNNVVNNGTGRSITLRNTIDVAGKTGTTTADFDRYFVGYTPYYVGGVWTGYDMNQSLSAFVQNPSVTLWDTVMTLLHQKYIDDAAAGIEALKTFEMAPGVIKTTFCKDSGLLCSDACAYDPRGSRAEVGYFTRETAPTEYCDTHVIVMRDSTTNLIASDECDPSDLIKTALIRVEDRDFPREIYVEDAQYVYRDLPDNIMPSKWGGLPYFYNMLGEGHFCGGSYVDTPSNAFCYLHADYSKWESPTEETEVDEDDIYAEDDRNELENEEDSETESSDDSEFGW
ncbi:MAG: transglycosylase domain-containing protein [Clostridia bacterium]|nr:transglycosylase domain-containing protein [Clostridia bacterium]